jgi:branched-chain amino acid transport system substrate-binding protein
MKALVVRASPASDAEESMTMKGTSVAGLSVGSLVLANGPGVSDTEIKIGNTIPYSGPASAYGIIGAPVKSYSAFSSFVSTSG